MAEWIVEIGDGNPNIKKMTELVRCKDCKYWERQELGGRCALNIRLGTSYNWFCADGRRENASE